MVCCCLLLLLLGFYYQVLSIFCFFRSPPKCMRQGRMVTYYTRYLASTKQRSLPTKTYIYSVVMQASGTWCMLYIVFNSGQDDTTLSSLRTLAKCTQPKRTVVRISLRHPFLNRDNVPIFVRRWILTYSYLQVCEVTYFVSWPSSWIRYVPPSEGKSCTKYHIK